MSGIFSPQFLQQIEFCHLFSTFLAWNILLDRKRQLPVGSIGFHNLKHPTKPSLYSAAWMYIKWETGSNFKVRFFLWKEIEGVCSHYSFFCPLWMNKLWLRMNFFLKTRALCYSLYWEGLLGYLFVSSAINTHKKLFLLWGEKVSKSFLKEAVLLAPSLALCISKALLPHFLAASSFGGSQPRIQWTTHIIN